MESSQPVEPVDDTVDAGPNEVTAAEVERLRHELQQYEEFLEGLPDAVVVIDLATTYVVAMNYMTTLLMGFTPGDVAAGFNAARLVPSGEFERLQQIAGAFISEGLVKGGGRYVRSEGYQSFETRMLRRDGTEFFAEVNAVFVLDADGLPRMMRAIIRDVSPRVQQELAHRETIAQLELALHEVRTLRGLIPMCAWCHKIRDDQGYWQQLEKFLKAHSDADFTHSICDSCATKVLSEREPEEQQGV